MHQPVLLFSEEVNFHASGWTMWTAPLLLLKPPARPLSHGDKGGTQTDGTIQKKKKKNGKKQRGERETEKSRI